MGKIVLIEPHRVLQQAMALSLSAEHEVEVEDAVSAAGIGSLKGIDLLIVDASALRERNQLSPEVARAIQSCPVPTLWLEENESSRPPKRDKLAVVMKPIESEAFHSALAGLLSLSAPARERGKVSVSGRQKAEAGKEVKKGQRGEAARQEAFQFIDLVDVVNERRKSKRQGKARRKSK